MLIDAALRVLAAASRLRARAHDDNGQTLAEYSMIITVIAVGTVLLAMIVFRESLAAAFNSATGCLDGTC
ncbi:MAG: hypothetical protein HY873_02375 [Chloroflexi bacterium]|nr:hypothetical protein [Chloroflexota bacterium]